MLYVSCYLWHLQRTCGVCAPCGAMGGHRGAVWVHRSSWLCVEWEFGDHGHEQRMHMNILFPITHVSKMSLQQPTETAAR